MYNLVNQRQALKGVGRNIAISVVAELGDFSRISSPKQIMAFLELISGEYSSGSVTHKAVITKVGNVELRRLMYEAAWAYRHNAKVGNWLVTHRQDVLLKVCPAINGNKEISPSIFMVLDLMK